MNFAVLFLIAVYTSTASPTPEIGSGRAGETESRDRSPNIAFPVPALSPIFLPTPKHSEESPANKRESSDADSTYIYQIPTKRKETDAGLFWVGVGGILIGVLTLVQLVRQTRASIIASKAAKQSADDGHASMLVLQRARIALTRFTFIPENNGADFGYRLEITNTGTTPGDIYERQVSFYPTNQPLPPVPPDIGEPVVGYLTISAGQTIPFASIETHSAAPNQTVYLLGVFRYRDIFGNEQSTRFCAEYDRQTNRGWIVTNPGYNTAT